MIATKTVTFVALAATPGAAAVVAPAFDWNPIIAALIVAVPSYGGLLLLYLQGRKLSASVNGVVSKLIATNTEKATAEVKAEVAPVILKLSTDKATAEATLAEKGAGRKAARSKARKR